MKRFIAVSADPTNRTAIYGIGETAEKAIADAVTSSGLVSNLCEENEVFAGSHVRDAYGDIIDVIYIAQECTEALYYQARNHGSPESWDDTGRVADVAKE